MISSLRNDIKKVISIKQVAVLLLILLVSYGFYITNFSIGIDALAKDRYLESEYAAQGRFGRTIICNLLGFSNTFPFAESVTSVLLLAISAIIFSATYKKVAPDKLGKVATTIFQVMFVAYSLINEIYIYREASLVISFCYFLASFIAWHLAESITNGIIFSTKNVVVILLLLTFQLLSIESFASVYLFTLFSLIWLALLHYKSEGNDGKKIWKFGIIALAILVGSVVSKYLLAWVIHSTLHLQASTSSSNQIYWFSGDIINRLTGMLTGFIKYYFVYGFWYYPIMLYAISFFAFIILAVIKFKRKYTWLRFWVTAGVLISTVAVQIIQGGGITKYSSCQAFGMLVAFVAMLFTEVFSDIARNSLSCIKKGVASVGVVVISIAVWYSAVDLNNWFVIDNQRYKEESQIIYNIADDLSDYSTDNKPVVFVGQITLSDNIVNATHIKYEDPSYLRAKKIMGIIGIDLDTWKGKGNFDSNIYFDRYNMANGDSCINWGVFAFREANTELYKILEYNGYTYIHANIEQYMKANEMISNLDASYPQKGYIVETEDFIVVYLGGKVQLE